MSHDNLVLATFWRDCGISRHIAEFKFHPTRKWRFDFAWPSQSNNPSIQQSDSGGGVALEVQGGLWTRGRHTRGAALLNEHEKLNAAAVMGWRILYCTPKELGTLKLAKTIKAALNINGKSSESGGRTPTNSKNENR
jgi:hypothetical protein